MHVIQYEDAVLGGTNELNKNVLSFLKMHKIKKVNLIGHSLGGALALLFAYHNPKRVKRLFLVDSEGIYGHENIIQLISNFFLSYSSPKLSYAFESVKLVLRLIRRPWLYFKLAKFAHTANLEKEASKVRTPTIILWGENDKLTPLWQGKRLHKLIKNSKLIVLKGLNHDWILNSPEKFWNSVKSHV